MKCKSEIDFFLWYLLQNSESNIGGLFIFKIFNEKSGRYELRVYYKKTFVTYTKIYDLEY